MLLLLGSLLAASAEAAGSLPPARDLRVEYAETPVRGVAVRRPRFGWSLEHPERGLRLLCQPQQLSVLILRPAPVAAGLVAAAAGASDAAEHITAVLEQRTLVLQARGRCNQAAPFSL